MATQAVWKVTLATQMVAMVIISGYQTKPHNGRVVTMVTPTWVEWLSWQPTDVEWLLWQPIVTSCYYGNQAFLIAKCISLAVCGSMWKLHYDLCLQS